jgi:hypothetical protein
MFIFEVGMKEFVVCLISPLQHKLNGVVFVESRSQQGPHTSAPQT